jgi:hypothetical protein
LSIRLERNNVREALEDHQRTAEQKDGMICEIALHVVMPTRSGNLAGFVASQELWSKCRPVQDRKPQSAPLPAEPCSRERLTLAFIQVFERGRSEKNFATGEKSFLPDSLLLALQVFCIQKRPKPYYLLEQIYADNVTCFAIWAC